MADAVATSRPPTLVELIWEHDLVFAGRAGDAKMTLDSSSNAGPSPVQTLAFALAGCMAMDVVHILRKSRHELRGLRADFTGQRAPHDPRRLTDVSLHFTISGVVPDEQVQRAIQLSKDKYCSVWHSMRHDIPFAVTFSVSSGT